MVQWHLGSRLEAERTKSDMVSQDTCLVKIQDKFVHLYDIGDYELEVITAKKTAEATTAALTLPPETASRILRVFNVAMA